MRNGLVFTTALTLITVAAANGAQAAKWCGTAAHENSLIECGYSSESECESALNKAGVCFIDPDYALNIRRAMPAVAVPRSPGKLGPVRG